MREESCSKPVSRLLEKRTLASNDAEAIAVRITNPKLRPGWLQKLVYIILNVVFFIGKILRFKAAALQKGNISHTKKCNDNPD